MSEDELISAIVAVYDELRELKVIPQQINLKRASLEQLESELEAVADQLAQRKRFLGVNE